MFKQFLLSSILVNIRVILIENGQKNFQLQLQLSNFENSQLQLQLQQNRVINAILSITITIFPSPFITYETSFQKFLFCFLKF